MAAIAVTAVYIVDSGMNPGESQAAVNCFLAAGDFRADGNAKPQISKLPVQ